MTGISCVGILCGECDGETAFPSDLKRMLQEWISWHVEEMFASFEGGHACIRRVWFWKAGA